MTSPAERPPGQRAGSRTPGRALIVGTGLIGGSLGMALRARGWHVSGTDADAARGAEALAMGALDEVGSDPAADVAFLATPVGVLATVAHEVLAASSNPSLVVTDVGGVKAPVVAAVGDARFVGGHPMAGSEQVGLKGADPDLFVGATWVLTPTPTTDADAYSRLQAVVTSLGADVVALTPADHDRLVAVVSHVPHLVAATLMNAAAQGAVQDAALLRLAAGGFRDMTRVAAGHPGIWPDVCTDNAEAIVAALDRLLGDLSTVREQVATADRGALLDELERASAARRNLPARAVRPEHLSVVRVPVPDREGVLAEITTLAAALGVNISDIEIAHSAEGPRGVLLLVVASGDATALAEAVDARGYHSQVSELA